MYNFLLISSAESTNITDLYDQIEYLQSFSIKVELLMDPSELQLIETIRKNYYDCAYVHVKRRLTPNTVPYDPVKILEYYHVPIVGNQERFRIMCHYYGISATVCRHIGFAVRLLRHRDGSPRNN